MTFGERILTYRKKLGITQEALASELGVSNQAVSKWESDQCCPDIALLPKLTDLYQISLDELFGRTPPKSEKALLMETVRKTIERSQSDPRLPWDDDNTLHAVLFLGHKLVTEKSAEAERIELHFEGNALNVQSMFSVSCDDVGGNVTAGSHVECGKIGGDAKAGGNIECGDIGGDAYADGQIVCGDMDE